MLIKERIFRVGDRLDCGGILTKVGFNAVGKRLLGSCTLSEAVKGVGTYGVRVFLKGRGFDARMGQDEYIGQVIGMYVKKGVEMWAMISLIGAGAAMIRQAEYRKPKLKCMVKEIAGESKRVWYLPWKKVKVVNDAELMTLLMEVNVDTPLLVQRG